MDLLSKFLKNDKFFKNKNVEVIVVVVDSTDNTEEIVDQKSVSFKRFCLLKSGTKVGKGRDVQLGMMKASGKIKIFMDADLATPLSHLQYFYETCRRKGGLVVATRNIRKIHKNIIRYSMSNLGNLLFRISGGIWLEDTQCGFKMFSSDTAEICFSNQTIMGWGFDMELLAIAQVNHQSIVSVRVDDWQNKPGGTFENDLIVNGLRSLVDFIQILYKREAGKYQFDRR